MDPGAEVVEMPAGEGVVDAAFLAAPSLTGGDGGGP
jgi:hypothetical protein